VRSVRVLDRTTGERHEVRARQVVIAAGPWNEELAGRAGQDPSLARGAPRHALAVNLVIGRRVSEVAVGLRSSASSEAGPGGSGGRFLFLAPQERSTLLGTWYGLADDRIDPGPALDRAADALLAEFDRACPGLTLSRADVVGRQWGRLPLKTGLESGPSAMLAERPLVGGRNGSAPANLLTVEAVKFTTARAVAQDVVDVVLASMGLRQRACRTAETPLVGAELPRGDLPPLAQRVLYAVREEMAMTLGDVVYRRTELGDPPGPEPEALGMAVRVMGDALGWDEERRAAERASVLRAGAA
jgi:glycerol-3-phosphate dehydrogenase